MNTNKYDTAIQDAQKMGNEELLKTFESVKSDAKFYTRILAEEARLKNPYSYRYKDAQAKLDKLNKIGPALMKMINEKGIKA